MKNALNRDPEETRRELREAIVNTDYQDIADFLEEQMVEANNARLREDEMSECIFTGYILGVVTVLNGCDFKTSYTVLDNGYYGSVTCENCTNEFSDHWKYVGR